MDIRPRAKSRCLEECYAGPVPNPRTCRDHRSAKWRERSTQYEGIFVASLLLLAPYRCMAGLQCMDGFCLANESTTNQITIREVEEVEPRLLAFIACPVPSLCPL